MEKTERRYDIDWIRTIAVLLIIPFHAAIIFNTNPQAIMYIRSGINVHSINIFEFVLDRFHMTLLFFLAGMSIYYSLQHRDVTKFLKSRTTKLLFPTIVGCLTIAPVTTYIYCRSIGSNDSFIKHYMGFFTKPVGELDGTGGGFTPMHLWFTLFLFVFSLIGIPFFQYIISDKGKKAIDVVADFFSRPLLLLLWIIPFCLIYFVEILDERNPIAYFFVVMIGFIFASNSNFQKAINRDKWIYLALGTAIIALWYFWVIRTGKTGSLPILYLKFFITKAARLLPVFAILALGNSFIKKGGKVLRYLSQASFPIYIIHIVVVTALGYFIIKLRINPIAEYFLIVIFSYIVCFVLYEAYRRTVRKYTVKLSRKSSVTGSQYAG